MVPSKGTNFFISAASAAYTGAVPAAQPSGTTLADTPYTVTGGDWTRIECVMEMSGFDDYEQEYTEHRCLDSARTIVDMFPTGYVMPGDITLKIEYDSLAMAYFRSAYTNRTKLRLLMFLPLSDTQTVIGDSFANKVRCKKAVPVVDAGGKPVEIDLTFAKIDDAGVYTAGN